MYYFRVVNLTGTTSVLGAKIEDTTISGVMVAGISAGGRSIADMTGCPAVTFTPVITDIAPTLCTYEAKEEVAGSTLSAAYDAWKAKWAAVVPNAEWVYTLSTPVGPPNDNAQQILNNATLFTWASANGYFIWDAYSLFGSWASLSATGWMMDAVHVSHSSASKFLANHFLDAAKLLPLASTQSRFGQASAGFMAVRYPWTGGDENGLRIVGPFTTDRSVRFFANEATESARFGVTAGSYGNYTGVPYVRDLLGGTVYFTGGNIVTTVGKGLLIKEGTNARMGVATLVGGTVTVSNTGVTANTRIFLTSQTDGGTPGFLRVSARTASANFTITSSSGSDTSTVAWLLVEPAL